MSLSSLGVPSEMLVKAAFMSGLPQEVKRQLSAMSDAVAMSLSDLLVRARAALAVGVDMDCGTCASGMEKVVRCYKCNRVGHKANVCRPTMGKSKANLQCYRCHNFGHIARFCPKVALGNEEGRALLVPEASPSVA